MILPCLFIALSKSKGRGVFTAEALDKNEVVEIAPVIVMAEKDRALLDQTLLHDYIFEWGIDKKQCGMALGYVPIYNHSFKSNCEYDMIYPESIIRIKTVRKINAGEELFINYNGDWDDDAPLWFTVD
ncbi:MAG: SET domain-containing protein-lysine N-methyltransferase [Chitinophagaceae bacterium]